MKHSLFLKLVLLLSVILFYIIYHKEHFIFYFFSNINQYGKVTIYKKRVFLALSSNINDLNYRNRPPETVDYISFPNYDCLFIESIFIDKENCDTLFCTGDCNSIFLPIVRVDNYSNPLKGIFWQDRFTTGDGNSPIAPFSRISFNVDENNHLIMQSTGDLEITEIKRKNM